MTIKVVRRDGESGERLLKRFSHHVKSTRLIQKFRKIRYWSRKPTEREIKAAAIAREKYRAEAKKREFLTG